MGMRLKTGSQALLAIALIAAAASAVADALTDRARRLIEQGQQKAAYELLLPQEGARAGDPVFDYLLGIAANDVGEHERAVFALERVLAVQPDNALARAEIAKAYFAMGERDTARREFETVRNQKIPPQAKETIDRFLSAIEAAEVTRVAGFVEFGIGYDSNVNSATGANQIAIPALAGIVATLDSTATSKGDRFATLSGGLNITHLLTKEFAIVGGATGAVKANDTEKQFDTASVDANLGGRWSSGAEAVTLAGQYQTFQLDHATYRNTSGGVLQWQHSYDASNQVTLYGQYAELRYPTQSIRDANRKILGTAYAHVFGGDSQPVLFASFYGGREDQLASDQPQLGHVPYGIRLGGQFRLSPALSAFANTSLEHRKYDGPEPLFLVRREDNQFDVSGGLSYVIRPGTTLIGQIAHTDNHSNVEIDKFRRTLYTLSLRFNF